MEKKIYRCFTAQEYIGETNEISVTKKEEKSDFPLHWHDFFEIEIIIGGNGTQILNGNEYKLTRGCAYLLSPTDYHSVKPEPQIELYNIMFHERFLSEEFLHTITEEYTNNIFYFEEKDLTEVLQLCNIIETEFKKERKYKSEFMRNLLDCFLIIFLRNIKSYVKTPNKSTHIQKALLYIQLHFKDDPSLVETAKFVNLNPNYFSQIFKKHVGTNYNDYLTSIKLSYAKKLLASRCFSVTEVCFASGFTSLSNFMKVFKQSTGISPAVYSHSRNSKQ
jgi:YesN/AraC family two-component response regulator